MGCPLTTNCRVADGCGQGGAQAAQPGTLGQVLARATHKRAGSMELRTGNSNQRHSEIVCAAAIAHNVNSVHQTASVSVPTACRAPWHAPSPHLAAAMPRAALAEALGTLEASAATRERGDLRSWQGGAASPFQLAGNVCNCHRPHCSENMT
jgi:hypothetical protein